MACIMLFIMQVIKRKKKRYVITRALKSFIVRFKT